MLGLGEMKRDLNYIGKGGGQIFKGFLHGEKMGF